MKSLSLLSLAALPSMVFADGFIARRRGAEVNVAARHAHDVSVQPEGLTKRATCGKSAGSCPKGQCCSASGNCGTTSSYCTSPQCQMAYSNGNCDGRYVYICVEVSTSSDTSFSKKPKGETTANIPRSNSGKAPYSEYSEPTLR
jgi:hypothetical protein